MGAGSKLTQIYSQNVAYGPRACIDGDGSSYINYEQRVRLWHHVANLGPSERAAPLILQMETVTHQGCPAAGGDFVVNSDEAERIRSILNDYSAPDAVDSIYRELTRFFQCKRTDQTMDVFLAELDLLRRKAESRMQIGGGVPEAFASILCMQNAALPRQGQSLVLASVHGGLDWDWDWPAHTRR